MVKITLLLFVSPHNLTLHVEHLGELSAKHQVSTFDFAGQTVSQFSSVMSYRLHTGVSVALL